MGNSWRKQATRLDMFRWPKRTRKVMLPLMQTTRRSFKGCFKKWRQNPSMGTRLGVKTSHIVEKHNVNLAILSEFVTTVVTWPLWHENEAQNRRFECYNELKSRIGAKKYSLVEKVKKYKICFILWENRWILCFLLVALLNEWIREIFQCSYQLL